MKIIQILILGTLFLSMLSCSQGESCGSGDWDTLDKSNYSIKYPSDWELKGSLISETFFLRSKKTSEDDAILENINLQTYELKGETFSEHTEAAIKQFDSIDVMTLLKSSKLNRDGNKGYEIVFISDEGKTNLKVVQHLWLKEKKVYLLTFTCEEKQYENYREVAEKIMNSFHLKVE